MDNIKKLIKDSPSFKEFISVSKSNLDIQICNTIISIYKHSNSSVRYYYKIPYTQGIDYQKIDDFMQEAIPALEEMLRNYDENILCTPNCINGNTLSSK